MDYDIADFAISLAQKEGAEYAAAILESTQTSSFLLKNGVPQIAGFEIINGLGLKIEVDGAVSFVSTNELEKDKVRALVERGLRLAKAASKLKEELTSSAEETHRYKYEIKQKKKIENISPEQKMKVLLDIEKTVLKSKIKVPARYFALSDGLTEKYFVNTNQSKIISKIPRISFLYLITVAHGTKNSQRFWQQGCTGGFENLERWKLPELLLLEVKQTQRNLKYGVKSPRGVVDAVVAPEVVGIMVHESGGHPYEADRIFGREGAQAGESFITEDMIGTRIGSEVVNIADNPTISGSYGFFLYDDEGVKAREKLTVKEGKINEFLHNRQTAGRMKIKSNGSARSCAYNREPIIRMSNTYMMPGDCKEEELIEGVKKGVYMKNFMEWNIDDKRINQKYVGAEAYLIENGRITQPVIRPVIELTTRALYSSVDAVANNVEYHAGECGKGEPMQGIPVWFGGPSIRLRKIRLGR